MKWHFVQLVKLGPLADSEKTACLLLSLERNLLLPVPVPPGLLPLALGMLLVLPAFSISAAPDCAEAGNTSSDVANIMHPYYQPAKAALWLK